MIGFGIHEVTLTESKLFEQLPCDVTPSIAAALTMGFRLLPPPQENHQDVIVGCEHLQDYRTAPRSKLTRMVTFRFIGEKRNVLGASINATTMIEMYRTDEAMRRHVHQHPRYTAWHDRLRLLLLQAPRCLMAMQGNRLGIIPIHGNPETMATFARFFEEGW